MYVLLEKVNFHCHVSLLEGLIWEFLKNYYDTYVYLACFIGDTSSNGSSFHCHVINPPEINMTPQKTDHFNAALYLIFQLSDFQRIPGLYLRLYSLIKKSLDFFFETKSLQKEMEGEKNMILYNYLLFWEIYVFWYYGIVYSIYIYIPFCWKGIIMSNLPKIIYN